METNPSCAIGVDLGGTRIKTGLVARDGRVLARRTIPTEAQGGPEHVIGRIIAVTREMQAEAASTGGALAGVVVGAPGALSQRRGVILAPPNLPGWREVPISAKVSAATGLRALLENDANAAALGELWTGAGRGVENLMMLTLGTGVGSGIVVEGRLLRGHFETAGELGHTIIVPDGRLCGCGQRGCLEAYASASSVAKRVMEAIEAGEPTACKAVVERGGRIDAEQVVAAAAGGDAVAGRVWDDACRLLAVACVNAQHVVNPEVIVLAGGMATAGEQLLSPVRRHFEQQTWKGIEDRPVIRLGALGDDAGFVGAAALLLREGL